MMMAKIGEDAGKLSANMNEKVVPYAKGPDGQQTDFWGEPLKDSFGGKVGQEIRGVLEVDGFILGGAFD